MKGTKKLLVSVVALIITLAMATTATYAWFTVNTYASVSGFNVEVKTEEDEGLYIKVKEGYTGAYKTSVTKEEIAAAMLVNSSSTPIQLVPLTTTDRLTLKALSEALTPSHTTLTAAENGEGVTTGKYGKFTLQFSSTKPGKIYLAETGNSITSDLEGASGREVAAWDTITKADYNFATEGTFAEEEMIPLRAANAARVTFNDTGDGTEANAPSDEVVWAPNYIKDTFQVAYYESVLGWDVTLPTDYKSDYVANEVTAGTVDETTFVTDGATEIANLVLNGNMYTAEVEVYVWLDGNDGACINEIISDAFTVALNFRRG